MNKVFKYAGLALPFVPLAAFAQTAVNVGFFESIITALGNLLALLLPVLIGLALILFLWGLVKFMMAAGDEAAKESGKNLMIWGVVILFVMVTVWGLVALLNEITGIGQGGVGTPPELP